MSDQLVAYSVFRWILVAFEENSDDSDGGRREAGVLRIFPSMRESLLSRIDLLGDALVGNEKLVRFLALLDVANLRQSFTAWRRLTRARMDHGTLLSSFREKYRKGMDESVEKRAFMIVRGSVLSKYIRQWRRYLSSILTHARQTGMYFYRIIVLRRGLRGLKRRMNKKKEESVVNDDALRQQQTTMMKITMAPLKKRCSFVAWRKWLVGRKMAEEALLLIPTSFNSIERSDAGLLSSSFVRWRTGSAKRRALRTAEWSLLMKRSQRVVSFHFGSWYIVFLSRFCLKFAEKRVRAKDIIRTKARVFFAWTLLHERSVLLKEGRRAEVSPYQSNTPSSSSSSLTDRRRLLWNQAAAWRYERLGMVLIQLRNKLCRARSGLLALEKWREYNAAVAVAVLIQKYWRGYMIRRMQSRFRHRIDYYRAYRAQYYPRLRLFIRLKAKRAVFRILLSYFILCRANRRRAMALCRERQALDTLKTVLFTTKWRSARFTQVAVLFRETTAFQKFWNNLGRMCSDALTVSASEHFSQGRLLFLSMKALKSRTRLGLKHRALEQQYFRSIQLDTLSRLLRWSNFEKYRIGLQKRCKVFLRTIKFSRHFRSLHRNIDVASWQYSRYQQARSHHGKVCKHFYLRILKDCTKERLVLQLVSNICFLRIAGPKGISHLHEFAVRGRRVRESNLLVEGHHKSWRLRIYLNELNQSFYRYRILSRKLALCGSAHHLRRRLRVNLANLRRLVHKNVVGRLLDDPRALSRDIRNRLQQGVPDVMHGDKGIRPQFQLISPALCPLPETYESLSSLSSDGRGGVGPDSASSSRSKGLITKYFDTVVLRKLFISEDFWARDDPRRRSMLRVLTSTREVLLQRALRRLHVNAFSPRTLFYRAMQVIVFERNGGPPKDHAVKRHHDKLRLRRRANQLLYIHQWLHQRDISRALGALHRHARIYRVKKTFYATRGLRQLMRWCLRSLSANANMKRKLSKVLGTADVHIRFRRQYLTFFVVREHMASQKHDHAVMKISRGHHMHVLAVKSFFDRMRWILRPRRKIKIIARKFYLRPLMATWLDKTASSFGVFRLQQRILSRCKLSHFKSWFQATVEHMKERIISEEVRRRSVKAQRRDVFVSWIEAIEEKHMSRRFDMVCKNRVLFLKRWVMKYWHQRCTTREAYTWNLSKMMFKSLFIHISWVKHQARCLHRAIGYHDRLSEITLFRKMLYKYRVRKRLMMRATQGHDYLIISGCKHAIRKWRYMTYFRVSYKKKTLSLLQQQSLGIGTFSGHYSELVVTTSSVARRLGLIPKEALSHGHGHVSYHERLVSALTIRFDSLRLQKAVAHWSHYRIVKRKNSSQALVRTCLALWKSTSQRAAIQRQGMIHRLRETLNRHSLEYGMKGFRSNLTMRKVGLVVETHITKRHLSFWRIKTSRRGKIRRMLSLLLAGHHFLLIRLHFRYWKALMGPARKSERVFFQETIFRRWRCCFVAMRHYKMSLYSQVFEEWGGLVFGRLAARFNVRRGRRIAARLLTRIRQQRCSKLRVFFNRWATKAEVSLPGIRIKNAGHATSTMKKRASIASRSSAGTSRVPPTKPFDHDAAIPPEEILSKEDLQTWRASIRNARGSETLSASKRFSLQGVADFKELAATTIYRRTSSSSPGREVPARIDLRSEAINSKHKDEFDHRDQEATVTEHIVHFEDSGEVEVGEEDNRERDPLSMSDLVG